MWALLIVACIAVVVLLYNALFSSHDYLPEIKERVEFAACGGYLNQGELNCPSNEPMSQLFIFEAPQDQYSRLIFFDRKEQIIPSEDMISFDQIFSFDRNILGFQRTLLEYQNPCEGPCVCMINIRDQRQPRQNECMDLDFQGEEIPIFRHAPLDSNIIDRSWNQLTSFFRSLGQTPVEEYEPWTPEIEAKPPYITPYRANWVLLIEESTTLHYFMLHIQYNPNPPQLLITQYNPLLQSSLS